MDLEVKCGQMALDMKVIGKLIKLTVKVNSFMLMEIYMKASGSMIKLMEKVLILRIKEVNIKSRCSKLHYNRSNCQVVSRPIPRSRLFKLDKLLNLRSDCILNYIMKVVEATPVRPNTCFKKDPIRI